MGTWKKTFEAWMREVDAVLEAKYGLCHLDLDDWCYRDAYDHGARAAEAARCAYKAAGGD